MTAPEVEIVRIVLRGYEIIHRVHAIIQHARMQGTFTTLCFSGRDAGGNNLGREDVPDYLKRSCASAERTLFLRRQSEKQVSVFLNSRRKGGKG